MEYPEWLLNFLEKQSKRTNIRTSRKQAIDRFLEDQTEANLLAVSVHF